MSVKIYEGLRAISNNPFEVAKQTKAVLAPMFFEQVKTFVEILKENKEDSLQDLLLLPKPFERLRTEEQTIFTVIDMLYKYPMHNFSPVDFGYDVILMPSANDDRILAQVFSENKAYRAALVQADVFEAFGYWDNSEAEEGLTEEEWDYREASWGYLLDDETPASIGLTIPYPGSMAYSMWEYGLKH